MREMVNGCCVCLDEKGYAENPLVYCDGVGCNIAVHQACYGIVSVPTGNWYCRKCESQEKPSRIRCELCPSKDGALKRTDNGGWAHVVCALYIPEVRFASVTTMEPIMVSQIPSERFNKLCYICRASDRHSKASVGACMQCNKIDCKLYFHVTCAQSLGLLCEEEGIHLDNVNYCGYCQEHYSKLKKSSSPKLFAGSFMQAACVLQQQQPRELHNNDINVSNDNQNQSSVIMATASKRNTSNDIDKLVDNKLNVIANSSNDLVITPQYVFTEDRSKKLKIERESPPPSSSIDMLDLRQNKDESADMNDDDDDVQLKFTEEPNLTIVAADSVPKLSPAVVSVSDSSADVSVSSVPPCLATSTFSTSVVTVNSIINDVSTTCSSSSTIQSIEGAGKDYGILENMSQQTKITNAAPAIITENISSSSSSNNNNNNNTTSISSNNNNNNGNKTNVPFHQSALINAPHMLGNQLNPSSTMARKMCDTLYAEIEDHSIYNESEELKPELSTDLIGPQLYSKIISSVQSNLVNLQSNMSFSNQIPQTLEQLLERQWEQGRSIDRTTHFDLASLLAGLHQISSENSRLDDYIKNMQTRINHLTEENRKLQEMIKIETAEQ